MKRGLLIPPQESSEEINNIFCKMLLRLCIKHHLMDEVVEIIKDCNLKYEIKEVE